MVLRWPSQATEARRLGRLGVPRLLLIEDGVEPPDVGDDLEAWLRMPADDGELGRRLRWMAGKTRMPRDPVTMDDYGRVLVGTRWVALSATQARMAAVLVASFGEVVTVKCLIEAGWLDHPVTTNNLRGQISRLRKRLLTVGLVLQTVRGRGVVLQRSQSPVASSDDGVIFGPAVSVADGDELIEDSYVKVVTVCERATTGETPILYDLIITRSPRALISPV